MMETVPHVTSISGLRKFQANGFLLTRVYKQDHLVRFFQKEHEIKLSPCRGMFSRTMLSEPPLLY